MTNPDVDRSSLPQPPEGLTESVGWHVVADEPPGTLACWDGNEFAAVAFWASDHWEFVTDDWTGPNPAPGVLPAGVGDPRESGWWQSPDGRWHGSEYTPMPPSKHPDSPPRSRGWSPVGFGCLAVALVVALGFVLLLMFTLWALGQMNRGL